MSAADGDGVYTVQILIQNSSDTNLTLDTGVLIAGGWVPQCVGTPLPGTDLCPTGMLT